MSIRNRTVVIAASAALLSGLAIAPATAQSPVPPQPKGPGSLSLAPLQDSGLSFADLSHSRAATSLTFGWQAAFPKASLQLSQSKPIKKSGSWEFPGALVASSTVNGTALGGGKIGSLGSQNSNYKFNQKVSGLKPATKYYAVARLSLPGGIKPVEQAWELKTSLKPDIDLPVQKTPTRVVTATVKKLHIIKDGDKGVKGKGEARFGIRLAPNAKPSIPSLWGDWSHSVYDYMKVTDNSTARLPHPISHTIQTKKDIAVVEIQGYENDVWKAKNCPVEGGPQTGKAFSDNCWDAAVATFAVPLPKSDGSSLQVVEAHTQRDPSLKFSAVVEVKAHRK